MANSGFSHPGFRIIQLSASARYALEGMVYLAGSRNSGFCLTGEVARERGLPGNFLAKIFRRLSGRGLLRARRGPGGGFALARDPGGIRVMEIVDAVSEPVPAGRRCLLGAADCGAASHCPAHRTLVRAERDLMRKLRGLVLTDLAAAAKGRHR